MSIIIDTFNAESFRALSHVLKEIDKADPTIADSYSTRPIMQIPRIVWIETARLHSTPDFERARVGFTMRWRPAYPFHSFMLTYV
jgi:hypothetical protein